MDSRLTSLSMWRKPVPSTPTAPEETAEATERFTIFKEILASKNETAIKVATAAFERKDKKALLAIKSKYL